MGNTRLLAAAAATVLLSIPAAHAADLPPLPPSYAPAPQMSGWYLRGFVGMTNQQVDKVGFTPNPFPNDVIDTQFATFDSSPLFGMGVGYQWNNWLRFDVTGEYRANSHFRSIQVDRSVGPPQFADEYNASKSEILFLANAFIDFGTWWCVTPFIGAGIGARSTGSRASPTSATASASASRAPRSRMITRSGASPGPSMRASPIRSRRTSTSSWRIGT